MDEVDPSKIDFSQFWVRRHRPDGKQMSGTGFDEEKFSQMFGPDVTVAFNSWHHFQGNPPTSEIAKNVLKEANTILEKAGLDPQEIYDAREGAEIIE